MRINFDLDDLEAFLAVKETGSFHQAAERLALSQSAVTRRVQKLETVLDVTLFERTTRSVTPTLAAKRLQPRAEAILEDARETTRAMRDESAVFAHQRNQIITVAAVPTIIPEIMPAALSAFRAGGYASRIRFLDGSANEASEAVAAGDADFGICSMPALDPGLDFELLFEDQMVLVVPKGHALSGETPVPWDRLAAEQVILSARNTGNRVLVDDAVARSKHVLRWTFETERSTTALALVAGGAGVAILPLSLVRSLADDRVEWLPLAQPEIGRPVGILSRAGQSSAEVMLLKTAIRNAANQAFLPPQVAKN